MRGLLGAAVLVVGLGTGLSQAQQPRQPRHQQQAQRVMPQEWKQCMEVLAEPEPVARLTGTVRQVSEDMLIIEDTFGRRVDLHGGSSMCLLWAGQPVEPSQLEEGTTVHVSYYVDEEDGVTARVVRVIEQQRPAPY